MHTLFRVLWPSFLAAGIAEMAFFATIEPQTLYPFGQSATLSPIATYSLGFLFFWLICSASSLVTQFLQRPATELNHGDAEAAAKASAPPRPRKKRARGSRNFGLHEEIHKPNDAGGAWRVVSGVVRLDTPNACNGGSFAGLALTDDVIGAETMFFGRYAFRATALTPVVLAPWPGAAAEQSALRQALARAEGRTARVLALRTGHALDRVARLIRLLATSGGDGKTTLLPSLRDMSDITALTMETVSRSLSHLGRIGLFTSDEPRRGGGGGKRLSRITYVAEPTA